MVLPLFFLYDPFQEINFHFNLKFPITLQNESKNIYDIPCEVCGKIYIRKSAIILYCIDCFEEENKQISKP